jgi:hypothetical protein
MALGSNQPLVKTSTRNFPGGKGGRCVRLTTSPPWRAECHEIREPTNLGTLWATPCLLRDSCNFTLPVHCISHLHEHFSSDFIRFWDVTQHRLVVSYRRFWTTCLPHLQWSSSVQKMLVNYGDKICNKLIT